MIALLNAVIETILLDKRTFLASFSYITKFPEDFPQGQLMRKEGRTEVRRLPAREVLNWMREKGYTSHTMHTIANMKRSIYYKWDAVDFDLEV